jgi:hypothetical protein
MIEDLKCTLRIKIILTFGEYIKTNLDAYNHYIVKDRDKYLSEESVIDLLIKEFILSANEDRTTVDLLKYEFWYRNSQRSNKLNEDYELYRLLHSIVNGIQPYTKDSAKSLKSIYSDIYSYLKLLKKVKWEKK